MAHIILKEIESIRRFEASALGVSEHQSTTAAHTLFGFCNSALLQADQLMNAATEILLG